MTRAALELLIAARLMPYIGKPSCYARAPIVLQALEQGAFSQADGDNPDDAVVEALGRIVDNCEAVPESAYLIVLEEVKRVYREYRKENQNA